MRDALLGDGLYLLRFWGRDEDIAKSLCPVPVGTERDGGVYYARFEDATSRDSFLKTLNQHPDLIVMRDCSEGEHTLTRTVAVCVFEYQGQQYHHEEDFGYGYPPESALFMFEEGNYGCDCNRSSHIRQHHEGFPELDCGDQIKLIDIQIELRN